jgi:hypothetical protein
MGMTLLEKNLQSLAGNYDANTVEAGTMLREISRDAFSAKPIDERKLGTALELSCPEAKPTAQVVVAMIKAIAANQ